FSPFLWAGTLSAHHPSARLSVGSEVDPPLLRQAAERSGPHGSGSACLSQLLEALLPETIRKVSNLSAQRSGLERPERLPAEEILERVSCGAPALSTSHRPLCQLPGQSPQRAWRVRPVGPTGSTREAGSDQDRRTQAAGPAHSAPAGNPASRWRQSHHLNHPAAPGGCL